MSESFAQLFEESLQELETRQGSVVKGTVVAIQKGFVLVDTGSKSESSIPAEEFTNAQGELEVKVGDLVSMQNVMKLGLHWKKLTMNKRPCLVWSMVK